MKHSVMDCLKIKKITEMIKERAVSLTALLVAVVIFAGALISFVYREKLCGILLEYQVRTAAVELSDIFWRQNQDEIKEALLDPGLDAMKIRLINQDGKDLLNQGENASYLIYMDGKDLTELYEKQRQRQGKLPEYRTFRQGENGVKTHYLTCFDFVPDYHGESSLLLVSLAVTPSPQALMLSTMFLGGMLVAMLLVAAAVLFSVYRENKRIVVNMRRVIEQVSAGQFDAKFAEDGTREMKKLAHTLNKVLDRVITLEQRRREAVANISHDLRTPLTMLIGYAEVMRDIPEENNTENIQVILEEANRLSTLVNDMLELSRYETGRQTLEMKLICLTDMLMGIVQRYDKLSRQREEYQISFEGDCRVWVRGDRLKLFRVVCNFINNACNHGGPGIKIVISQQVEGEKVIIKVTDNGGGMSPEQLEHIWNRYYRARQVVNRAKMKGSGLGLCIVKEILQQHEAPFGAESELGKGSTFWFQMDMLDCENFEESK